MEDKRESEVVEFKKTISELKEGIISLCSMLNKRGYGKLYFGIKNDGSIYGQEIGKLTTTKIVNEIKNFIKPFIYPKIEVLAIDGKNVICVEASGDDTPYAAYGRYYMRCDDQDLEMTQAELEKHFLNKNITYANWENIITEFDSSIVDEDLLIRYIEKANEVNRMNYRYYDMDDALIKLGLLVDGKLNNAGYYLFAKNKPLTAKYAIYATDEMLTFIDTKQFSGNIFECIEESAKYILNNIHYKAEIIGLERVETPEIPVEAIREIVINSYAHAKYSLGEFNEIIITPSKIRIYNPGSIVYGKDPIDFADGKIGSKVRNPLIALTLYKDKTIDAFGTGFRRVFNLCKKAGINYKYSSDEFGFYFEFIRNKVKVNELINDTLNNFEKELYNYAKKEQKIENVEVLASKFSKSPTTIKRTVSSLVQKGFLIRVGSKKNGYWKVIK